MKPKLMALMLAAGGALFGEAHVAIGVQVGRPVVVPAPVVVNSYRPPYPGPGYVWVEGYYDEIGNWYAGYWALPPYSGAYWVAPRFSSGRYYAGYWGGPRGVYRAEPRIAPRVAPRAYEGGRGGASHGPAVERHEQGFRDRGSDRGQGRGGDFRQGFRR